MDGQEGKEFFDDLINEDPEEKKTVNYIQRNKNGINSVLQNNV